MWIFFLYVKTLQSVKYLHIKQMMDEWSIANTSGSFSFVFYYFVDRGRYYPDSSVNDTNGNPD